MRLGTGLEMAFSSRNCDNFLASTMKEILCAKYLLLGKAFNSNEKM